MQMKRPAWVIYALLLCGTGFMALAIQCIYDSSGMVVGGFTGIAIIVKHLTRTAFSGGIPLWFTNLAINIPVFLLALKIKGKRFVGRTAVATVLLSLWLYVIPQWDITQGDYILASIYGGTLSGIGIGMVLLAQATTGGTDMVAALIQHRIRHYSIVQIMVILDGIIVLTGIMVFGVKPALYAVVSLFITSRISDVLTEGLKYSKGVFIISSCPHEVAKALMEELNRGVTGICATGMYTNSDKNMLYCVVSKKEIVELKAIVTSIDKQAFVIVSDVREVLGEGFSGDLYLDGISTAVQHSKGKPA